jgi:hypothetical protein
MGHIQILHKLLMMPGGIDHSSPIDDVEWTQSQIGGLPFDSAEKATSESNMDFSAL